MAKMQNESLKQLSMQPIIVFDFDGVIVLGSERTKQKCWLELFQPQGEEAIKALTRALERYGEGRGSRYDIIRDVLQELGVSKERLAKLVETYSNEYAQKVQTGILAEGIRNEDRQALDFLAKRAILFINTTTPQSAIEEILDKLGISHLFKRIFGRSLQGETFRRVDVKSPPSTPAPAERKRRREGYEQQRSRGRPRRPGAPPRRAELHPAGARARGRSEACLRRGLGRPASGHTSGPGG